VEPRKKRAVAGDVVAVDDNQADDTLDEDAGDVDSFMGQEILRRLVGKIWEVMVPESDSNTGFEPCFYGNIWLGVGSGDFKISLKHVE
jgi:hypothetical protein